MRKVRILLYHRVEYLCDDYNMLAVTPDNFEKHMCYLSKHYDVLSLEEPIEKWFEGGERDAVIITFDDGYYDFLYNAVPVLKKYHIPATIFISTGNIDTGYENWTDSIMRAIFSNHKQNDFYTFNVDGLYRGRYPTENYQEKYDFYQFIRRAFLLSTAEMRQKYEKQLLDWSGLRREGRVNRRIMTSDEIRKLVEIPGISIGAHTVTHAALKYLSEAEQKSEILESKRVLEEITGKNVKLFSYPFGTKEEYSKVTVELLKDAGFEKSVVAYSGSITKDSDTYELCRFTVNNYDEADFITFVDGCVFGEKRVEEYTVERDYGLPIEYVGKLEGDQAICNKKFPIVIWGTGYWGRKLYLELMALNAVDRIIAFGDNNINLHEEIMAGISIMSLENIREMQRRNGCHIFVKGKYDFEICRQLIREGIKHIHLIQM